MKTTPKQPSREREKREGAAVEEGCDVKITDSTRARLCGWE